MNDPLGKILDFAIQEAQADRDRAGQRDAPVDEIRALANSVTKLREAKMWRGEAFRLNPHAGRGDEHIPF